MLLPHSCVRSRLPARSDEQAIHGQAMLSQRAQLELIFGIGVHRARCHCLTPVHKLASKTSAPTIRTRAIGTVLCKPGHVEDTCVAVVAICFMQPAL